MTVHGITRLVTESPGDFERYQGIDVITLSQLSHALE
jgi:hypothetical protein